MESADIRPCGPEELEAWTRFLDRNFGYQSPHSYAIDFAPLFEANALEHSRIIVRDNTVVSSATLYPVTVITPNAKLRLGIIGAVATGEAFRGQGYSSKILSELESSARNAGLQGLILWSDQTEFYAKAGFKAVGYQDIYPLANLPAPRAISEGTPQYGWDIAQVRSIYEQHPMRSERSEEYWRAIEKIRTCTRVQWVSSDGVVRAYLGFDRGKDLQGIVHEWGGEPHALYSLVWTVLQSRKDLHWLTHPLLRDPIWPILSAAGITPVVSGTLALFKSISRPTIANSDLKMLWFWGLDSL